MCMDNNDTPHHVRERESGEWVSECERERAK